MEITIINNKESFLALKSEWEALEVKARDVTYYSTFRFLYQWYTAIAENNAKLCIISVYEKKEVVAIAPLMIETRKFLFFNATVLRFLGRGDLLSVLIDKNVKRQAILKGIFDVIDKQIHYDKLELTHIASSSDLAHFFFKSEIYNPFFKNLGENPIISIPENMEFSAYKKLFFGKNINYYRNKLRKELNARLEVVDGGEELESISKIHINRNSESKIRRSLFKNEKMFNFIKKLYETGNDTKTFLLKTETGDIISYATCYFFNGVLHNWNMSFNIKYKDYRAGDLIYFEMINYAFENKENIRIVDFGAGRYAWKFRMTDNFLSTYTLNLNREDSKKYTLLNTYDKLFSIGKIILK